MLAIVETDTLDDSTVENASGHYSLPTFSPSGPSGPISRSWASSFPPSARAPRSDKRSLIGSSYRWGPVAWPGGTKRISHFRTDLTLRNSPSCPPRTYTLTLTVPPPPGKGRDGTVGSDRSGVGSAWVWILPGASVRLQPPHFRTTFRMHGNMLNRNLRADSVCVVDDLQT